MKLTQKNKKYNILLVGGGTAGSVVPLLGIISELKKNTYQYNFLWLGTKNGPEKELVEKININFKPIVSGKLRRYWSLKNFFDPIFIIAGFFQSLFIILKFRPNIFISAGSFISVPVAWSCALLRVPILIHQQDVKPGLANKLIAPFAKKVTVTFEKSLVDYGKKAILVGNSIREEFIEVKITKREAIQKIGLKENLPVLLVLGGGTGAMYINELIVKNIQELTKFCQIIHVTGKGKGSEIFEHENYRCFEFLDTFGIIKAFTAADGVVSRCGMGVLTELSYFALPSILIPIPSSHQEDNADFFKEKEAAIILNQNNINNSDFVREVKKVLSDEELRNSLKNNISSVIKYNGNKKIAEIIEKTIKNES